MQIYLIFSIKISHFCHTNLFFSILVLFLPYKSLLFLPYIWPYKSLLFSATQVSLIFAIQTSLIFAIQNSERQETKVISKHRHPQRVECKHLSVYPVLAAGAVKINHMRGGEGTEQVFCVCVFLKIINQTET